MALPTGRLTFMFSDIEGSTRLLSTLGQRYTALHAAHQRIVREAIRAHAGTEVSTEGDSFFVVFHLAVDALEAAASIQRGLAEFPWPEGARIRVRIGIHTGQGVLAGDDYVGLDINRAARIANAANGGQIVMSDATRSAAGESLPDGSRIRDLGRHRLKDIGVQRIWQLDPDGVDGGFGPLRTLEAHPTNLPTDRTSLVGREAETLALTDLVRDSRLTTVTGPGGIGKSRLAIRVARGLVDDHPDGVFYIDAATHDRLGSFLVDLAEIVGIRLPPDVEPTDAFIDRLLGRSALLVVDTADRLPGFGRFASQLLDACGLLRILVTARGPLHVHVEREYVLRPLGLGPDVDAGLTSATSSPAVALFVERARAVRPDLPLTPVNVRAIAAIVSRLDGLPLAIELAAARSRLLAPQAMLARLDRGLPVLKGGALDAPERQRTMTATIEWSYDLLAEDERTTLQRLSVFADVFDLDAATIVCAAASGDTEAPDPVDVVERLVDRSLVQVVDRSDHTGLRLLGLIREFAAERLAEGHEEFAARRGHATHFLGVAEAEAGALDGPDEHGALVRLERSADDFRAALAWLLGGSGAPDGAQDEHLALRFTTALGRAWYLRGRALEASDLLERAIAADPSAPIDLRAEALHLSGVMHDERRQSGLAMARLEAALALLRTIGDPRRIARELNSVGVVARNAGETERAMVLLEESLSMRRALGDDRGIATTLTNLGVVAMDQGRFDEALERLSQAVILDRASGRSSVLAYSSCLLGTALIRTGDRAAGIELVRTALRTFADLGDADGVAECLERMGEGSVDGDPDLAARLLGAAAGLRHREGIPIRPPDEATARDSIAALERRLDRETLETLRSEGEAMDIEAATAFALASTERPTIS